MRRRDISKVLFASTAGSVLLARHAQAQACNPPCFPLTQAEINANVAEANYAHAPSPVYDVHRLGVIGDGDGAGGGTNDALAFQKACNYARDTGGTIALDGSKKYRLNSAITLLANSTVARPYIIEGNGAVLDFSGSGLTSGSLLSIGADSLANIAERGLITIRNLFIRGPETGAAHSASSSDTMCIGLNLQWALNVVLENVTVMDCWEGIRTKFVFPLHAKNVKIRNCYVPVHHLGASNNQQWDNLQLVDVRFGPVLEYDNAYKIVGITYSEPRIENAQVGFVMDPRNSGSEQIRDIHIYNPYLADIDYDFLRAGRSWDPAFPSARGSDRTGSVTGLVIHGGNWGSGGWTASHAALCFPDISNGVRNVRILLPSEDTTNAVVGYIYGGLIEFVGSVHDTSVHFKPVLFDNNGLRVTAWETISPAQISANQNDYNPTGLLRARTIRISTNASRNITGLSATGW